MFEFCKSILYSIFEFGICDSKCKVITGVNFYKPVIILTAVFFRTSSEYNLVFDAELFRH